MKNKVFITGVASISAQDPEAVFSGAVTNYHNNIIPALTPNFKDYIPSMALRRMSKAVKMGITAAKAALEDGKVSQPDAIITGTGQGCKQDTEKFLEALLEQEEGLMAPTSFIQSTHNTVGGQIALNLKCHSYNVTYTQNSGSLEAALIDAQMQFQEQPSIGSVLVGGVDEISAQFSSFLYLDDQLKQEQAKNLDLFKINSPGTITSEGAHFFTLSATKVSDPYAELVDVCLFGATTSKEVSEKIIHFLFVNEISINEIDLLILGKNGDARFDHFYTNLQDGIFNDKPQLAYKHLVGDYNTVSGYSIWLGCKILKKELVPEICRINLTPVKKIKKILLYNEYLGENHSLIILSAP